MKYNIYFKKKIIKDQWVGGSWNPAACSWEGAGIGVPPHAAEVFRLCGWEEPTGTPTSSDS